jgi:predicted metallopeptidase
VAEFKEANDLLEISRKIINVKEEVSHIEIERILFLWELETKPGSGSIKARTYKFGDHPIGFFTELPFGIIVYEMNTDYFNENQIKILMFHELLHIPKRETDKLIDHDVKDFRRILGIDLDWNESGRNVPDILE